MNVLLFYSPPKAKLSNMKTGEQHRATNPQYCTHINNRRQLARVLLWMLVPIEQPV